MCSTPEVRLAEIGNAIEALAAEAAARYSHGRPGDPAGQGDDAGADHILTRLAELWARLAELDPDMATRLPRYQA